MVPMERMDNLSILLSWSCDAADLYIQSTYNIIATVIIIEKCDQRSVAPVREVVGTYCYILYI